MTRKVVLAELQTGNNMFPLVSAYLKAYARADPEVRNTHDFISYSRYSGISRSLILSDLVASNADVYAFSCYVWNMKLIRYLLLGLQKYRPESWVFLGGPQVDGHGAEYLTPSMRKVVVCNGEGERTFRNLLLASADGREPASVNGLTFYRDGSLVNTGPPQIIEDINTIPSPFLDDSFDGNYTTTVWETNRGCPYACTFCYWGKGEDRSVRKFETARLSAELDWLARKNVLYMMIGDANWGMFARDVDLTREIVKSRERFGAPLMVQFAAAKARIDRTSEIAVIFHDAGIISSQAIGIQSTTDSVLRSIRRKNIDLKVLTDSAEDLERRGVNTYTEVIWPLPGESLESFRKSITSLCDSQVSCLMIYPALLLHSTPMEEQVEEYSIVTADSTNDGVSELQLIVSTRDASPEQVVDGIWLAFAVYCLYNARTLRAVGRYLSESGIISWGDLCWSFARFSREKETSASRIWHKAVVTRSHSDHSTLGGVAHSILHEDRAGHQRDLVDFILNQEWGDDEIVRALLELDLLAAPYLYSNTDFSPLPACLNLKHASVRSGGNHKALVTADSTLLPFVSRYVLGREVSQTTFSVDYYQRQFPFMAGKPLVENFVYSYGMILRGSALPQWTEVN